MNNTNGSTDIENLLVIAIAELGANDPTLKVQNAAYAKICSYLEGKGRVSDGDIVSLVELVTGKNSIAKTYAVDIVVKLIEFDHAITDEQKTSLLVEARKYDHTHRIKLKMDTLRYAVHSTAPVAQLIEVVCGHFPQDIPPTSRKYLVHGAKRGLERRIRNGRELSIEDTNAIISAIIYGNNTVAFSAALTLSDLIDHGLKLSEVQLSSLRNPAITPMVRNVCSGIIEKADRLNLVDLAEKRPALPTRAVPAESKPAKRVIRS